MIREPTVHVFALGGGHRHWADDQQSDRGTDTNWQTWNLSDNDDDEADRCDDFCSVARSVAATVVDDDVMPAYLDTFFRPTDFGFPWNLWRSARYANADTEFDGEFRPLR